MSWSRYLQKQTRRGGGYEFQILSYTSPPVMKHGNGKWTIERVSFPIKSDDFPQPCEITRGYIYISILLSVSWAGRLWYCRASGMVLWAEAWNIGEPIVWTQHSPAYFRVHMLMLRFYVLPWWHEGVNKTRYQGFHSCIFCRGNMVSHQCSSRADLVKLRD